MNFLKLFMSVFVIKLLIVTVNTTPNDYQECAGMDDIYRLVHRGFCYYLAASSISKTQQDAKRDMCGTKGRLALPNDEKIIDFVKNRLRTMHYANDATRKTATLIGTLKAWIGLEQKLDETKPDSGWYYEGRDGKRSTIDPALFFFGGISTGICGYSVPDGCVEEFTYKNQTYRGCTRVDDNHCWCSTIPDYDEQSAHDKQSASYLHCGQEDETILGANCLACDIYPDCEYYFDGIYFDDIHYNCNCPGEGGVTDTDKRCFPAYDGVRDGEDGIEKNKYQQALITQEGNILEAAELHQYRYAICQFKAERGALMSYKGAGFRVGNGVTANMTAMDVETCALQCYHNWACAAFSFSEGKKLCLQHSIPVSHKKAILVEDAEFAIWDHEI